MNEVFLPAKSIFLGGESIWIYQEQYNYIMRYDVINQKLQLNVDLSREVGPGMYSKILAVGNAVYLIPEHAECIVKYNMESGEINKIKLPECISYSGKRMFCNAIKMDNKIYCMPYFCRYLVVLDCITGDINQMIDIAALLKGHTIADYFESIIAYDNKVIGVLHNTNKIFVLDITSLSMDVIEIGSSDKKYTTIASNGRNLFLYEYTANEIFKYSLEDKKILKIIRMETKLKYRVNSFGDNILLDSINGGDLVILNGDGEVLCKMNTKYNVSYRMDALCVGAVDNSGKYYYNSLDNYIYYFDGNDIKKFDILKTNNSDALRLNEKLFGSFILRENKSITFESYIKSV